MTKTCPNCGVVFETRNPQKTFHRRTCAKSYWEKQKRKAERLSADVARQQVLTEMAPTVTTTDLKPITPPQEDFQWPTLP